MLRQKIDWEKVPWLMTKVKVSEEYYVNYWRHRPFQREWEGEGKPGRERERKKGLQSRCHQDTGPQAPISCHLSSAQTSSPHFLFGLHNVTKEGGTGANTAQKRGSGTCGSGGRELCGSLGADTCACARRRLGARFFFILCQNRDSDTQGRGVSPWLRSSWTSLFAGTCSSNTRSSQQPRPAPVPFTFPKKKNQLQGKTQQVLRSFSLCSWLYD